MATYIIGDIQGHWHKMSQLLKKINFNPEDDFLYSVGDIVNRGENSLAVLQWFYDHQHCSQLVLGNHDLYLIRLWLEQKILQTQQENLNFKQVANSSSNNISEDLQNVLQAENIDTLMIWLCAQPLFHVKHITSMTQNKIMIVHAGFPPDVHHEEIYRIVLQIQLKFKKWCDKQEWKEFNDYLQKIWKSRYTLWHDCFAENNIQIQKDEEMLIQESYILNCITQIRWWNENTGVLWKEKGFMGICKGMKPWWYFLPNILNHGFNNTHVFCGHWSSQGLINQMNFTALDSGVAWGRGLTAYHLEQKRFFIS